MKVLYFDMLSPVGHKDYNSKIIEILSCFGDIDVAIKEKYWNDYEICDFVDKIYEIPDKYFANNMLEKFKLNKLSYRFRIIRTFFYMKKKVNFNEYNIIFFSSFETVTFFFFSFLIKNRCLIVNHNNISEIINSKIKRFFFKHIKQDVEFIVLEEYIKIFLEKKINIKNKVWVVKYPLDHNANQINECKDTLSGKKIVFAPGGGNDENFVDFLLDNEEKINDEYMIIIKSQKKAYDSDKIKIFKSWITENEYNYYLKRADLFLVPYKESYNYRVCSIIFEAIQREKPVMLLDNNTLGFYKKNYPGEFVTFKQFQEFIEILNSSIYTSANKFSMKFDYSKESISDDMKEIILLSKN